MKSLKHSFGMLVILLAVAACGGPEVEAKFFTEGNCQECGDRVAAILEELSGVKKASWDMSSKQTSVVYDGDELTLDDIQQALADEGFNTQYFDGLPGKKQALPACCREGAQAPPAE